MEKKKNKLLNKQNANNAQLAHYAPHVIFASFFIYYLILNIATLPLPVKILLLFSMISIGLLILFILACTYIRTNNEKLERLQNLAELDKLKCLNGFQFEDYVKDMFKHEDWDMVEQTPKTNDGGIDLILWRGNTKTIVECKQWNKPLSRPIVQKLHSAKITSNATDAYIVSTNRVTKPAKEYAKITGIKIIAGERLVRRARSAFNPKNEHELLRMALKKFPIIANQKIRTMVKQKIVITRCEPIINRIDNTISWTQDQVQLTMHMIKLFRKVLFNRP